MLTTESRQILDKLADCPLRVFEPGDVVLAAGSRTGRLLFLQHGMVDIVLDGVELTRVTEPGAVFGDIGILLGLPHTADVLAVQSSSFYVVEDAAAFLQAEPMVALYVAAILAGRLDAVNHLLVEARNQVAAAGQRRGLVIDLLDGMRRALHLRVPPG